MLEHMSPETEERSVNGEFLDWTAQDCRLMSEEQFITARDACSQAWRPLQTYMRDTPQSLFTELYASRAPAMLADAIIAACASQPRDPEKRFSVDRLCDAALVRMGFIIARDEFGVEITGDAIRFPARDV